MPGIRYLRKMISGMPVVVAPADIDITTTDQLGAVLLDAASRGHATIVVDMTRTRFCDSCGLHTMLRAHQRAVAEGGGLRLVVPADGAVPRIFAVTCLDRLIPCFASLEQALARTPAATIPPSLRPAEPGEANQSTADTKSGTAWPTSSN